MIPTFQIYHPNSVVQYMNRFNFKCQGYFPSFQIPQLDYFTQNIFTAQPTECQSSLSSMNPSTTETDQPLNKSISHSQNMILDFTKPTVTQTERKALLKTSAKSESSEDQSSNRISKERFKAKFKPHKALNQNRNRNIVPSIVQQIFSYLSKPNKSKSIVEKISFTLEKPDTALISIQRYYYFIKHIKEKLNHYLNANSMAILWRVQQDFIEVISKEEQAYYLNVARRVTKHFLENLLPLLIIHSKRMFEDKRAEHLKVRRILLNALHREG